MFFNSLRLKKYDVIKDYCVDGSKLAVIVYSTITDDYAFITYNGRYNYKKRGNAKNKAIKENYHFSTSENDRAKTNKLIHMEAFI